MDVICNNRLVSMSLRANAPCHRAECRVRDSKAPSKHCRFDIPPGQRESTALRATKRQVVLVSVGVQQLTIVVSASNVEIESFVEEQLAYEQILQILQNAARREVYDSDSARKKARNVREVRKKIKKNRKSKYCGRTHERLP
jgi:hypothetical protein